MSSKWRFVQDLFPQSDGAFAHLSGPIVRTHCGECPNYRRVFLDALAPLEGNDIV